MLTSLAEPFAALEGERTRLEGRVCTLSEAQLRWQPEAGAWSIAGIVEHLVLSDENVGRPRALSEHLIPLPTPGAVLRRFVIASLKRDVRLPLPSPALEPTGDVSLSDLLARWEAVRQEMKRELEKVAATTESNAPYDHEAVGALTAQQMLELGLAHVRYHGRQIARLQENANFPRR